MNHPVSPVARPQQPPDLIVYNAGELLTVPGPGPQRGSGFGNLGIIPNGAVAVTGGQVVAVGPSAAILDTASKQTRRIDAGGRVVMPGLVDAHTHAVFAGDRADEFEQRIAGRAYLDILAAGGGILSTVRATRAASQEHLAAESRPRLQSLLTNGTTTVEVKTGYGLDVANEVKMLAAIRALAAELPLRLVPTCLGAHAVPAEYAGRADAYVDLVIAEMLPAVQESWPGIFVDVFCDQGAFSLEQTRRILQAARERGFRLKVHVDEFVALGGTSLAVELGATSADHLATTGPEEMDRLAASDVVAVLLPGTTFGLGQAHWAAAREMIHRGVIVALGSDLNPGTCWCESMPFILALACRYLHLTPAEAIVAATRNAAFACGLGGRVGSLVPGAVADLIILDYPSYRHLPYRFGNNPVQMVIVGGNIVFEKTGGDQTADRSG